MEVLLEVLLAVEVDVVVADGDEAGVGGLGQPEQAVELSERPRAALVGYVAIDDAEEAEGVGVFVAQELLHAAFRVEVIDNLLRHLYTGNYSCIFDDKLLAAHLSRRDATERGMVAVANILFEPNGNQFT